MKSPFLVVALSALNAAPIAAVPSAAATITVKGSDTMVILAQKRTEDHINGRFG